MNEDNNEIQDNLGMEKDDFKKRLQQQIDDLGMTLAEISKETKVPKSNIHSWLNGSSPNLFQVAKVANFLGVTLDELLYGKQTEHSIQGDYLVRILKRVK